MITATLSAAEWGGVAAVITAASGLLALLINWATNRGTVRVTEDTGKQRLLDGIIDALAEDRERNRQDLTDMRTRLNAMESRNAELEEKYRLAEERHEAETRQLREERDAALQQAALLRERVEALEAEVAQLRQGR